MARTINVTLAELWEKYKYYDDPYYHIIRDWERYNYDEEENNYFLQKNGVIPTPKTKKP